MDFKTQSEEAHHRVDVSSHEFVSRLYRVGIVAKNTEGHSYLKAPKKITLDLRGAGHLNLWDFATLAVLIRKLATAGTEVDITWPGSFRGDLSGLQQFLEGLRFADLFSVKAQGEQQWLNNVRVTHYPKSRIQLSFAGQSRFVPLNWIDKASYEFTGEDLWRTTPKLGSHLEERVRKLFLKEGFDDLETIDEINNTFLYELGWNIVLHSEPTCGAGFGVFCAQLSYQPPAGSFARPSIALCVCDCGIGIPRALSACFASAIKDGSFNQHLTASIPSQIVRLSFDPHSTSRPVHASEVDKTGTRGLAHVAAAVQHVGSTILRSDGGAVKLASTETTPLDYSYDDGLAQIPLPGTQAVVFLRKPRIRALRELQLAPTAAREFHVCHVVNSDGTCKVTNSSEAEVLVNTVSTTESEILFDLGFSDKNSRQLEYLIAHATNKWPKRDLLFWNVRNLAQLELFLRNLSSAFPEDSGSLALSGLHQSGMVLGPESKLSTLKLNTVVVKDAGMQSQEPRLSLLNGKWELKELERVNSAVNSHLLDTLGRSGLNQDGVFIGKIHLPSGKIVPRYFSLLDNTKSQLGGNMTRWVEGCYVAASMFVEESQKRDEKWTILSFTGTTRDLCWQVHQKLGLPNSCAHVLMTFELPTRRDIASLVVAGDNVLLLTDAISTGTLVSEVIKLLREVGGVLRGVITCVDSRIHPPRDKKRFIHNSVEAPLRSCAELFTIANTSAGKPNALELWVDPVSLVPQQRNTWEMPKRILDHVNRSIELVVECDAAACGHLIEGTRHSSVYVRVGKLAREAQPILEREVHGRILQRFQERGWDKFNPSCILYPFGIARLEALITTALADASQETAALTPARLAADIVRVPWPRAELVEVPRAFDSAGKSQCSKGTLPAYIKAIKGSDVLVVDDGMWKGTTANALLHLAVELGATRVGIVPFLARFTPEDMEYWESITEVYDSVTQRRVPCCYVFPLFLPIPFTTETECPYEATLTRIKDKLAAREFAFHIPDNLMQVLRGHNPFSATKRDPAFTRTWLQLRCLAEMAVHSEAALGQLQEILRSEDLVVQTATFQLLLEEWALLGRPRIRQTIAPAVREKAKNCLHARDMTPALRLSALSFLRSHHLNDFLEALPTLPDALVKEGECLERILLHIATLPEAMLGSENCLAFFEKIAALNLIGSADPILRTSNESEGSLLQDCYRLWIQCRMRRNPFRQGKRSAAIQVKAMLEDRSFYASHEVKGFLRVFAEEKGGNTSPPETFKRQLEAWETKHLAFFADVLLPVVKELRPSLICMATGGLALPPTWAEYLLSEKTTIFRATSDLTKITESLSQLASGEYGKLPLRTLRGAAQRLLQNVIDLDSYLLRLVNGLCACSITEFIQDMRSEFELRLSQFMVDVSVQGLDLVERNRKVFAPKHMLTSCINHMTDNLEKYAFLPYTGDAHSKRIDNGMVQLRVMQISSDHDTPSLAVEVFDNGNLLPEDKRLGGGTTWLNSNMRDIDASFDGPSDCHEIPWTVVQRATLLLW